MDNYFMPVIIKKEGNCVSPLMKIIYPLFGNGNGNGNGEGIGNVGGYSGVGNNGRNGGKFPEIRDRSGKVIPIYSGVNDKNNNVFLLKEAPIKKGYF